MINAAILTQWLEEKTDVEGYLDVSRPIEWVQAWGAGLDLSDIPTTWCMVVPACEDRIRETLSARSIPCILVQGDVQDDATGASGGTHDDMPGGAPDGTPDDAPGGAPGDASTSHLPQEGWLFARTSDTVARVAQFLQMKLFRVLQWERTLSKITAHHGSLQDLVDASEHIFGNYITVTDWNFRLLAHTKHVPIEDRWIEELVQNGYHSKASIDRFRNMGALARWAKQTKTRYANEERFTKYPIINHVFHLGGYRFIQMVMSCNHVPQSNELMALFETFVGYAELLIGNRRPLSNKPMPDETTFLLNLIDGEALPGSYIEAQASRVGIPVTGAFRLYEFELTAANHDNIGYLIGEMNMAFKDPLIIRDETRLFVLLQKVPTIADIVHFEERLQDLSEDYAIRIGASDQLDSLEELALGYRQTSTALRFGNHNVMDVYRFADYLHDLLMHGIGNDRAFIAKCIRSSFLEKIKDTDRETGNQDARLLRCYLENERRIVPTAEALGLHRNTVSARIKKLLVEYDLDLATPEARRYANAVFALDELLQE